MYFELLSSYFITSYEIKLIFVFLFINISAIYNI